MARCDQGYLCDVCGGDVEAIVDSDLYLRYVMGEVDPLALPTMPERHIRCNPAIAQYVVDQITFPDRPPHSTGPAICKPWPTSTSSIAKVG